MKKFLKAYVEKINEQDGILEVAVASDSSVDRDGERIMVEGFDLTNFRKNPVLLWAHDYRSEPIGKVLSIGVQDGKLLFQPQFAINISEKAKQIFEYYKQGFLNAFSVGFMPQERNDDAFTKVELLEISAVPVPANPNALVMVRGLKSLDQNIAKQMESYEEPVEMKAVVPYQDLGIVENLDAPWQASDEVKNAGDDVAKLKDMSAWYDADKSDTKTAYKLPHHRASDKKAVWKGVSASMAALLGARGGVDLPENDRKGVYDHLAKHYAQFGKNPPEFKLVEAQILKDVDLDLDSHIVVNVLQIEPTELKAIKNEIESLKSLAAPSGNESPNSKGIGQRSSVSELIKQANKQGLQKKLTLIDRLVGQALREIKQRQ